MNSPITCFTALIDIAEDEQVMCVCVCLNEEHCINVYSYMYVRTHAPHTHTQCEELEEYLRNKGSDITSSPDTELLQRLQQIIEQCHVVFEQKELPQQGRLQPLQQ